MPPRRFTLQDQQRFARLSGDANPLHLDPVAARRSLLGGVAVHGMHLLLWALEVLAAEGGLRGVAGLRVRFERGALVGEAVQVEWQRDAARLVGLLGGDAGTLARITLTPTEAEAVPWRGPTELEASACEAPACEPRDLPALAGRAGTIALVLPDDWRAMFPHLAAGGPSGLVAVLLASTRLVGMVCPGLHSVYAGLQLTCDPAAAAADLHWQVIRADPRVRLVDMAVAAGGVRGTVMALLRPQPYRQPPLAALRAAVPPDAFAGQQALVIGGSRGLGELAAKLLAAGGAEVTLTWRQGEVEAQAILAEATACGLAMRTMPFDVAAPDPTLPLPERPYSHLYYFATPRIPAGRPGQFQPALFAALLDTYVAGLARCVAWLQPRGLPAGVVWYPSTVFIDRPDAHFAEYAAAKACGEALCAQLAGQLAPLQLIAHRLPRLATDQTQALAALALADGVAVLRDALLELARLG